VSVGDYRIIYIIADDVLLIVVVALGHRREVYEAVDKVIPVQSSY
jgi:mRNA interferase RelE/StbE